MPDYLLIVSPRKDVHSIERLVRAKNEARAIAHVVKDTVTVERAKADDLIRLAKAGVEIEIASEQP